MTNEIDLVYDGNLLIQERNTNGGVLVTYTRGLDYSGSLQRAGGIGGLLARTDGNGSTFYHADGVGNVTALMDGSENITGRYLYGPFGKPIGQWGPMANANKMRFSSMPYYSNPNIYGYLDRFLDPNLQRWLNQDPIREMGGINLYGFVGNNPVNWVDPLGLEAGYLYNPDGSMTLPNEAAYAQGAAAFGKMVTTLSPYQIVPNHEPDWSDPAFQLGDGPIHEDSFGDAMLLSAGGFLRSAAGEAGLPAGAKKPCPPQIPQKANNVLSHVKAKNAAPPGYKGGRTFANDGRGGGQVLPKFDAQGNPIAYREFDVNPYQQGVNRGSERIVVGSDGNYYYTDNHYTTFTQMK
jgi:RHS repeat-associated protein